ncbi:MAG: fatty acid desaturase, partial [Pseudomonadota bacterium]
MSISDKGAYVDRRGWKVADYDLVSGAGSQAVERGLAAASWYHTDVDRLTMKALMQRTDGPATRDAIIWIALLAGFGASAAWLTTVNGWLSIPFWLVYGLFAASASDARWHECGHGTAFKTRWKNKAIYHIASFYLFRNPVAWRRSHSRHHSDTIIVGRDPEIAYMRPPDLAVALLNIFGLQDGPAQLRRMVIFALGKRDPSVETYVPEWEWPTIHRDARIHLGIHLTSAIASLALWSPVPLLLTTLPRFYGSWHMWLTGLTQHAGLANNVLDHRLNTRTVYMNRINRFIYLNMNYHVEHHMYP